MHPNYWKFPNRNVQTFGFFYHDTNGQNHGPVWKTQSFLLSEICMVIIWQDCYGKGNLRKSYCSTVGRRFPIENAYSYTVKKGLFLSVYVDDIKLAGKNIERKASQRIHVVWVKIDETASNTRPDHLRPEIWRSMSRNSKMKEKQNWASEKHKLENARRLWGIHFIDLEDKEFQEITKNAWKKLEVPAAPAMPCKKTSSRHGAIHITNDDHKSKFPCIMEAEESKRLRIEGIVPKIYEDHIAGKGPIHCIILICHTNLFLCLKPWRFLQQRQQWIKNGRNWKRFRRGTWRKSETNQRWSMKQGRRAEKFILLHWWTYVIWRMLNWRPSTRNTKVELYSEATLWKMILDLMLYSPTKDHQHHKWQQQKSWISSPDCLAAQDKQLMQYLLILK